MPSTCHPSHTFQGVPKGLAKRVCRTCSTPALYKEQSTHLKNNLFRRGYQAHKVQAAIDEMSLLDRQSLLQYRARSTGNRVPMVTTYHPVLKDLTNILKRHIPILHTNKRMSEVFKDPPMAAFRRPRNLKDMVVRTHLENPLPNGGFKICTDGRCLICKQTDGTDSFNPLTPSDAF